MNRSDWEKIRSGLEPHDHAVAVFDDDASLSPLLHGWLTEGASRNELMVFVHSFAQDEDAWKLLAKANPQVSALRPSNVVLVNLYKPTFEGEGSRIDTAHVEAVVASLVEAAAAGARSGVRIFVDASRRYFAEGRMDEWFAFEAWLGRRLDARAGLVCAYQRDDIMRPDIFPRALDTHAYRFGIEPQLNPE